MEKIAVNCKASIPYMALGKNLFSLSESYGCEMDGKALLPIRSDRAHRSCQVSCGEEGGFFFLKGPSSHEA